MRSKKSNYELKLSIILMFLTIYGVEKSQCDHSKGRSTKDKIDTVDWILTLNEILTMD